MRFDADYVKCVLNDNFEDAKAEFFAPLMSIHYAHLVMLTERGIVPAADARLPRFGTPPMTAAAKICSSSSSASSSRHAGRRRQAGFTPRAPAMTSI